jgi:hypothetical protein
VTRAHIFPAKNGSIVGAKDWPVAAFFRRMQGRHIPVQDCHTMKKDGNVISRI